MCSVLQFHSDDSFRIGERKLNSTTESSLWTIFLLLQPHFTMRHKDFLNAVFDNHTVLFDYIIANPPYIRTQILGSEKAQQLSKKSGLSGRIDAYYAFLLCVEMVLKSDGVAGFITSNKFLTIKSGESVRSFMLDN